jgi:putative redox protein
MIAVTREAARMIEATALPGTCMTISARMALVGLGVTHGEVRVRVHLEREESATRFRYELILDPALEPHRPAVMERIERSPVRATLSKQLIFEPASRWDQSRAAGS